MTALRDFTGAVPQAWSAEHDAPLRCVQVCDETHDVKTFVFATDDGRSFRYLPGQFVTLQLQIEGRTLQRCYTLSSSPTRPDLASITVKRVPGGAVSNWLHAQLRVGDTVMATGPAGSFSCFDEPAQRYLFLSGGSGITPMMSMTRALHDLASPADVVFMHCARSPADVLFADELAGMARRMATLRLVTVCEQQPSGSAYAGHLGRVDAALLARAVPDLAARDIYTCGPAPFMATVRELLAGAGCDMRRYRQESFAFEADSTPPAATDARAAQAAPMTHRIRLHKAGTEFHCRPDQTILQAAVAAGLRLPSSCSSGVCGTCKTKKLSGVVEMKTAGGIRQREVDQGWILPCCSRPVSEVLLER